MNLYFLIFFPFFIFSNPIKNGKLYNRQNFNLIFGLLKSEAALNDKASSAFEDLKKACKCDKVVRPQTLDFLKKLGYNWNSVELNYDFCSFVLTKLPK